MEKRQHGGARPGSGRPRGTKNLATIEKEAAREAVRQRVLQNFERLVDAQISNACGIYFLVVREKTTGKFLRVGSKAAEKLNPEEEIIEVFEKVLEEHNRKGDRSDTVIQWTLTALSKLTIRLKTIQEKVKEIIESYTDHMNVEI